MGDSLCLWTLSSMHDDEGRLVLALSVEFAPDLGIARGIRGRLSVQRARPGPAGVAHGPERGPRRFSYGRTGWPTICACRTVPVPMRAVRSLQRRPSSWRYHRRWSP